MVIKDIPLPNEDFVYGISFVGPPGIGKTTISHTLSDRLGIHVTSNDKIRRQLDSIGIAAAKNQPLVERLAYDRSAYMLENNTSMIIDANVLTAYKKVDENFSKYNVESLYIKLECNEEEILRRLAYRATRSGKYKNNYSTATKDDYYKYIERLKSNPFPENRVFFTLNLEKDLDVQIDMLVEKIKRYIKEKTERKLE